MTKNLFTKALFAMGAVALMASCAKSTDLFDQDAIDAQKKADAQAKVEQMNLTYAENFVKRYGKIDPNQTWDFTTATTYSSLSTDASTRAVTSVTDANFDRTVGKNFYIKKDISEYMFRNLPKGNNNAAQGRKFKMIIGENDFTIVPIFQGCASYYWELWMDVEDVGISKIWSKGEDLTYRTYGTTGDYQNVGTGNNGMPSGAGLGPYEVKAPTYTYNNLPQGKKMSFFLRVWTGGYSQYQNWLKNSINPAYQPVDKSSTEMFMLDLQGAPVPDGLPEGYTATIIGCEDGTDKDYEDLVFMVYGNPVPPTERVEEEDKYDAKRYIVEDLGDTDDFDFNDVVFDIYYNRVHKKYYYNNADDTEPFKTETTNLPSYGIVRAAGGIYDIEIKIGDMSVWKKSDVSTINTTDMVNTQDGYNPNYILGDKFVATNYIASQNNVSVVVETRGDNENMVYTIPFPEAGEAPKIVAVPISTNWMTERTKVPVEWYTPEN